MSRSLINLINTTAGTDIAVGGIYPLNQVNRKFGCDIIGNGVGATCKNSGYYRVTGMVSVVAGAEGVVTAQLYVNGLPYNGAISSLSAASGATVTLPINTVVRVNCCANPAELTIVMGGVASTTVNADLTVTKE